MNVTLSGLLLDQVGGNGVMFSNSVVGSTVADCEFVRTGDSAVVFLGSTSAIDGSAPTFPNGNAVLRNHMHETGVYGKQTSCFAQQLSANSVVRDNVCYNGARAGINLCVHLSQGWGTPPRAPSCPCFSHPRSPPPTPLSSAATTDSLAATFWPTTWSLTKMSSAARGGALLRAPTQRPAPLHPTDSRRPPLPFPCPCSFSAFLLALRETGACSVTERPTQLQSLSTNSPLLSRPPSPPPGSACRGPRTAKFLEQAALPHPQRS